MDFFYGIDSKKIKFDRRGCYICRLEPLLITSSHPFSPTISKLLPTMNNVDYTPVLLAQITDLSMRVTNLEAVNTALKAEIERLTGQSIAVKPVSSVKTSVPLTAKMHMQPQSQGGFQSPNGFQSRRPHDVAPRGFQTVQQQTHQQQPYRRNNHHGTGSAAAAGQQQQRDGYKQLTIQDVLHLNEEVTIQVRTVQEDESVVSHATCNTVFDGVHLVVKACELVPELIGLSSTKPGEILYKFIEALTKGGHIKRAFSTAPWKLCFVERDGKRLSLEDLRH